MPDDSCAPGAGGSTLLRRLWAGCGGPVLRQVAVSGLLWLVFFICLVPAAIVLRALGKDPLGRRPDAAAASYWRQRSSAVQSMRKQY